MRNANQFIFNAAVLFLYGWMIIFGLQHHELWGDEIHSWNIAKGSHSLQELFGNMRYEGHPPFWYMILFGITQFTHDLFYLQVVQFVFAFGAAVVVIFYAPFGKVQKLLILTGYYFVFEYGVLARNYSPAIFFAFCLTAIFPLTFRYKNFVWYSLLLLLSNVHLLGLLLAAAIHIAYCSQSVQDKKNYYRHGIAGLLILLPAVFFILPPGDSQLNFQFWKDQWSVSRLYLYITVVVRSMFPIPDAGTIHWWNTNLFLSHEGIVRRIAALIIFTALSAAMLFSVYKSKIAFRLLAANLLLTFLLSLIFPLNTARYTGFVLIGYVISAWLAFRNTEMKAGQTVFTLLLFLQVPPGIFALASDSTEVFSSSSTVKEMHAMLPPDAWVTTDYWCLNNLSAFLDTSVYCLELNRNAAFLKWNSELRNIKSFDYQEAIIRLMKQNQGRPFYFFTSRHAGPEWSAALESKGIRLRLLAWGGTSVERSGQVLLYQVSVRQE